jgi:hypothetical protein
VNQEDGAGTLKCPGWLLQPQETLEQQGDKSALPVKKEKCDYTYEWWEHGRQRDEPAQNAASGKIIATKQEGERNAYQGSQQDADERDPHAAPERLCFVALLEEKPYEIEGPAAGLAEALYENQDQRVDDEPYQQNQ